MQAEEHHRIDYAQVFVVTYFALILFIVYWHFYCDARHSINNNDSLELLPYTQRGASDSTAHQPSA